MFDKLKTWLRHKIWDRYSKAPMGTPCLPLQLEFRHVLLIPDTRIPAKGLMDLVRTLFSEDARVDLFLPPGEPSPQDWRFGKVIIAIPFNELPIRIKYDGVLSELLNSHFDVVIDLTPNINELMTYYISFTKCSFRFRETVANRDLPEYNLLTQLTKRTKSPYDRAIRLLNVLRSGS